jgi:hypothetical protein
MADQGLIDGLIATYRELNTKVRPLPEDRLKVEGRGGSVRESVTQLRDREMEFSQALKERITGVPMPDHFGDKHIPVIGTESEDDTTAEILSQFGTARESTLAMLRTLPDKDWDSSVEGGEPIRARINQLYENDRQQLEQIVGLLGAP